MPKIDRRKEPRFNRALRVAVWTGPETIHGHTVDISEGGAFITTDAEVQPGETVDVELSFPDVLAPVALKGVVRWTRSDDRPHGRGFGVEWTAPPDDAYKSLLRPREKSDKQRIIRVVIADDNPHVRRILAGALLTRSRPTPHVIFDVFEAADGKATWDRIESARVDLVLLDYYMPILDGAAVLRRIRESAEHATLPVIVVSAGDADAKARALDAGADRFISKPLRLVDVLDAISGLVDLGPP